MKIIQVGLLDGKEVVRVESAREKCYFWVTFENPMDRLDKIPKSMRGEWTFRGYDKCYVFIPLENIEKILEGEEFYPGIRFYSEDELKKEAA